jgi:hypothetical protein
VLGVVIACGLSTFLGRVFDAVYRENPVSHVWYSDEREFTRRPLSRDRIVLNSRA